MLGALLILQISHCHSVYLSGCYISLLASNRIYLTIFRIISFHAE